MLQKRATSTTFTAVFALGKRKFSTEHKATGLALAYGQRVGPIYNIPSSESEVYRMNGDHQLQVAIYRKEPVEGWNIRSIDVGSLLMFLAEEPIRLGEEAGEITTEVTRTHESELVINLLLKGTEFFAATVIEKIGERVANWIADQAKKLATKGRPEVRGAEGQMVDVDVNDPTASMDAIVGLMKYAAEHQVRVQLVIEPL
jgi:hypothetical protein